MSDGPAQIDWSKYAAPASAPPIDFTKYEGSSQQEPTDTTNANMALAMSGQQKQMKPADQEQFEAGKKAGVKSGIETTGMLLGGETVPALRGVVGGLARILGSGAGAAGGNLLGQLGTTGKVDPYEAAQSGAGGAALQGGAELFGAGLPMLRSSLGRLSYTGELAADGTPKLTKLASSLLHPTELPENIFRSAVPPPPEVQKAMFEKAGAANAADLEQQMTQVETARQKELAQWERLKNQDAQARMTRGVQQSRLDATAAKAAPAPSPFGNAVSTDPVSISSLGQSQMPAVAGAGLPQGNATPFGQPKFVSKFEAPEPSRIANPNSPAPAINKTYVSYPGDLLVELAKKGDLNAVRELIRNPRGININDIPGVRYLIEQGRPGAVYGGPKE